MNGEFLCLQIVVLNGKEMGGTVCCNGEGFGAAGKVNCATVEVEKPSGCKFQMPHDWTPTQSCPRVSRCFEDNYKPQFREDVFCVRSHFQHFQTYCCVGSLLSSTLMK